MNAEKTANNSTDNQTMKWTKDLRTWLETLAEEGELKRISVSVECGGEIQEIGRRMSEGNGPAILFENIEGYQDTWCTKLFVGSLNTYGKVALALGLSGDASRKDMIEQLRKTLRTPIAPVFVESGPVKDNIITGNDVDLNEIPVPKWHPRDQGRYINTWAAVVTKDPDTGTSNVGVYRGLIHDKNHIGVFLLRTQGWGIHYNKYIKRGEPMPVACVYGWDPSLILAGGSPVTTIHEWEWMGAIRGEPVPLVTCETIDIQVPASSEIVIEGSISTDSGTYRQEGPFKEGSGRYAEPLPMPVMEVNCISYRDNPIMVGSATGLAPVMEEQVISMSAGVIAILRNALEDQGVPGVLDLTLSPFFAVKIEKMFQGHAFQVATTLFGHKALNMRFKMLVVVEDDVDINEPNSIINAINTNMDPERDIYRFPTQRNIVDYAMSSEDAQPHEYGGTLGNKMLIDATCNWIAHPRQEKWGGERLPPCESPPAADAEKVLKKWKKYGF